MRTMQQLTMSETERLFAGSEPNADGCRLYQGQLDPDGYGIFWFRRRNRRAHRVVYWLHYGDIPTGMVVNHTCRTRNCIEIAHLRLATPRENALRESESVSFRNSQKTHCPRGHAYDRQYGRQRYCSTCEKAKTKRLRAKWKAEDTIGA